MLTSNTSIDRASPRKKLPESPMNIFAGGKLKIKKPRHPIKNNCN